MLAQIDAQTRTASSPGIRRRSPKRYLFQVRNRRGLGHLVRALNIAKELRELDPPADILFYLRAKPAAGFWSECARYTVDDHPAGAVKWLEVAYEFDPDVVVYDTMLPDPGEPEADLPRARRAYIMRRCQTAVQHAVFEHPLLARIDGIVIPHTREEFGYQLPEAIAARARYVGPIVRRPSAAGIAAARARYSIAPGDFVLVCTAGGGGFDAHTDAFFATVWDLCPKLVAAISRLRHIVVLGPNYSKSHAPLPGMTVVKSEPRLVDLFAASDLVIAEGGYNTVEELRATRTPAIFLPALRRKDDQAARVRALEAAGVAFVHAPGDVASIAQRVLSLEASRRELATIRERFGADGLAAGNREAAAFLFNLARP